MTVLSVATTAATVVTQVQAAKAQNKAIDEQLVNSYAQIADAEVAEKNDRSRAARREQARIKIAAGESGLSLGSGSIETLLMDNLMQTQLANERTSQNAANQRKEAAGQANQMYSHVQAPNLLGAGLQIGSAGYNAWSVGESIKIKKGGGTATGTSTTLPAGRKGPPE